MAGSGIPRWMWALADDFPFAQAPEGVSADFDHPSLVGYHSLTIGCSICIALAVLFAAARLYAKVRIIRKASIDDYFFWVSLPMLLTVLSLYIYLDNHGAYGYHAWEIKIRVLTKPILACTFLHQMFLPATTWLIKATLLFLILGAFKTIKWLRLMCCGGIITMFLFYAATFAIAVSSCRPRGGTDRVSFLAGMASRECAGTDSPIQKMSLGTAIFAVISDIYILILPLPAVRKLNIRKKKKLGVYIIFSSGALACFFSILSLGFRIKSFGTKDLTVDSIPNMVTNMVELTVGLIITCIASVSKLARLFIDNRFGGLFGGNTYPTASDEGQIQMKPRRKHFPGGLSELDSMKTFGTTVDTEINHSTSLEPLYTTPTRHSSVVSGSISNELYGEPS
ncbi:hypothetical protein P171DRAFT_523926 [Karstenula rhodostoma CBS 690.94]|uniref:Rhodopsin domain-containing protein n=1 Tax=Karstenula rhodostoma CBS 690.94 TaxID=1392251 RepID=A0A9P4P9J5_9PLEO|nr:hypothetical protein P171DRAFT_523926 [Karstenula rhodostoma CBS 690.94]